MAHACSQFHFPFTAKPENLSLGAAGHRDAGWVIGVEDSIVSGFLIFEDTSLSVHIGGKGVMPVKMVGRDIEHDGNSGMKSLNGFELEARYLEDSNRPLRGLLNKGNGRGSNIAPDHRWEPACRGYLAGQRGCCRLAVRAG